MNTGSPLDADQLRQLNALLEHALTLADSERTAWLSALPEGQRSLAPRLQAMLARAVHSTDSFMRRPITLAPELHGVADRAGDSIGPYRLLREIGSGGMATVWLAERSDGAFRRQVALKLPRVGWAPGLVERMSREGDILAALEQPNIARLYDAGVSKSGRPYLAMEYVDGLPIDVYARQHGLSVEARVRLFLRVTAAVAYAHARLVVHRDLKPNNILVTSAGDVRLLDFGVAKLLAAGDAGPSPLTELAGAAFTREYASPEQIEGAPLAVATDVYSLGVVLYELLSGERPYALRRPTVAALEEAILGDDLPPASQRATLPGVTSALRGDLDNILAKALKRKPDLRYSSAEALAADLQRHLADEPVTARAPNLHDRVRKFIRRNRLPLAASAAVSLSLVAGLAGTLWQAREATRSAQLAQKRLAHSEAVVAFSSLVLTEGLRGDEAVTLDMLLKRSEDIATSQLSAAPAQRAAAVQTLAYWYAGRGDHARAEAMLSRTLGELATQVDPAVADLLRCQHAYATAKLGRIGNASTELDAVLKRLAAGRDVDDVTAACLHNRSLIAREAGDAPGALAFAERALEAFDRAGRESVENRALLVTDIGYALAMNGRPSAADARFHEADRLLKSSGRANSRFALSLNTTWGVSLGRAGQELDALARTERAIQIAESLSPDGAIAPVLHLNEGTSLRRLGRLEDALQAHRRGLEGAERGRAPADVLTAKAAIAIDLVDLGRLNEAEQMVAAADAQQREQATPPGSTPAINLMNARARLLQAQGNLDEADAMWGDLQSIYERSQARNPALVSVLNSRADVALAQGRFADATRFVDRALELSRHLQGDRAQSAYTGQTWLIAARLAQAAGDRPRARQAAIAALSELRATLGPDHPSISEAARLAGDL